MFLIARKCGREVLSLSTVECIVLLTLWFIILSCLGHCNKRPSHIILLNRSIVHAIRPHVSEVPYSGTVSDHTIYVPRPSPNEPSLVHLLQPSQGLLNKPCSSAAQSDHISQTNRALGLRRGSGMVQNTECGYTFRK